ncbi:Fc.00g045340.m01.CDS01, partial [Cosmosporella sp. VM-42]
PPLTRLRVSDAEKQYGGAAQEKHPKHYNEETYDRRIQNNKKNQEKKLRKIKRYSAGKQNRKACCRKNTVQR